MRELEFAIHQMLREAEEGNGRYAQIIRQVLKEFIQEVETDQMVVETEVSLAGLKSHETVVLTVACS